MLFSGTDLVNIVTMIVVCVYVVFSRLSDCLHIERVKTDGDGGEVLLDLPPHHRPGVARGVT